MAVERWTGNACEILEIDPRTLVEMAAEDEPVLRAPRVPISGLNIAAAVPNREIAKSIQSAMASSGITKAIHGMDSKRFADTGFSPELRQTMEELLKVMASPAMTSIQKQQSDVVKALGSSRLEAIRRQTAEIARVAKSPAAEALRRQRL